MSETKYAKVNIKPGLLLSRVNTRLKNGIYEELQPFASRSWDKTLGSTNLKPSRLFVYDHEGVSMTLAIIPSRLYLLKPSPFHGFILFSEWPIQFLHSFPSRSSYLDPRRVSSVTHPT